LHIISIFSIAGAERRKRNSYKIMKEKQ